METLTAGQPEPWALAAARMPLAFAQVREDPRLDLELARRLPAGAEVVMIASGGETAACLGRLPLRRLHLVDMNPAQLALARCKWHLAETATPESAAALLGHEPLQPALRGWALEDLLDGLGFPLDVFGPMARVAELGPDHAGRYELAFAELRAALALEGLDIPAWLNATVCPVDAFSPASAAGRALDAAFARVMALPNLVALFGEKATQNPRQDFHAHFAWRTRETTAALPPAENPFLWQIFAGQFPPGRRYDWLSDTTAFGQPFQAEALWHHGRMNEVLDGMPARSADFVHLSNILDWLSGEDAAATLQSAYRVLRPSGRTIIRQLNSTLDIPALPSGFNWDRDLGADLVRRDRSFFYPHIHVGRRA
ncbi:MAG: hypothetical protein JWO82_2664 [Akkermansiaceae bacterium]|nr:hypothetical protein [Akkermansiaceae bacterium]